MYEQFGFGLTSAGQQRLHLFVPDAGVDTFQYVRGGPSISRAWSPWATSSPGYLAV